MNLSSLNPTRGHWSGTDASTVVSAITVAAGNNSQALAVQLTGEINLIATTSATASTGVKLPAAVKPGDTVLVSNGGAQTTLVYPVTGGVINALSANAGFSLATGTKAIFVATSDKNWLAILSA